MSKWVQDTEAENEFRHGLALLGWAAPIGISGGIILGLIVWAVKS